MDIVRVGITRGFKVGRRLECQNPSGRGKVEQRSVSSAGQGERQGISRVSVGCRQSGNSSLILHGGQCKRSKCKCWRTVPIELMGPHVHDLPEGSNLIPQVKRQGFRNIRITVKVS